MSEPTPQQRQAIEARGNVLVMAGAGTGKTRTLVERCLRWILGEERGSVDEILMVTFTKAAAAEMRQRLRDGLEAAHAVNPSTRLLEQLALLETSHISTMHSFCYHLVSQHFYELKLDGPLGVLSAERAGLLASEAMDAVLDKVYDGKIRNFAAIQEFIRAHGADWDKPTREIVRRLHEYRHSLRDPAAWLAAQRERFSQEQPDEWRRWLLDGLEEWRQRWREVLSRMPAENTIATQCANILQGLPLKPERADFAAALAALGQIETPRGSGPLRKAIEEIFSEAEFLHSVTAVGENDPLVEDWDWTRPSMLALLDLTEAYGQAYADVKRAAGGVDYQDLEQFTLRLLWENGRRTAAAEQWQKKFRLIFVDEFQDINDAQDGIIRALGREGAESNRFLVGDVKQSIYRFRLADPGIFKRRKKEWESDGDGASHALTENFRSHEGVLDFVNALFHTLMRGETGSGAYDENSRLVFGDRANRAGLSAASAPAPRVELHLRLPPEETDDEAEDAVEQEARMIGLRLKELKDAGTTIQTKEGVRAVQWSDMAALLRSPRHKVEGYVKAFARLGIPLVAARGGFYETMEARDLLNLLLVLDNPLQDLPLLGVLVSPFAGLTPRELALVRLGGGKERFWNALVDGQKKAADPATDLHRKTALFLERFHVWRRLARQSGVSRCLERALDETQYTAWAGALERGPQRRANVERFLQLTREFDAERGEGLSRFLRLIKAQQDNEIDVEPGAAPAADAVRLLSIHQSKGLEFPVVALGDLGKKFDLREAAGRVIVDEALGLCARIKPPGMAPFYPSVAFWLAQRRQKRETVSEELRLLYVAMTRAKEWLILAGTTSDKQVEEKWPELAQVLAAPDGVGQCHRYLDWIGGWLAARTNNDPAPKVVFHRDKLPTGGTIFKETGEAEDILPEIRTRMDWTYPFKAATEEAAKTSVTALKRQSEAADEEAEAVWFGARRQNGLGAAEIGSAHHILLEAAALEKIAARDGLAEETARLHREGRLSAAQVASLDMEALLFFWQSETGRQLLAESRFLRRELAFTARFARHELAHQISPPGPDGEEFVVVQGAVDLAAVLPGEIWIVDFKTDQFAATDLEAKIKQYRPQLEHYGAALARIYRRPVTRSWLCFLSQRKVVLL